MKRIDELKKYRAMTQPEIVAELKSAQKKLTLESLQVSAGKSENYAALSAMRKTVARLNTLISAEEETDE